MGRVALGPLVACTVAVAACGARTMLDPPPVPPTELALGLSSSCLLRDGQVRCWGSLYLDEPGILPSLNGSKHLSISDDDACAIVADGTLRCWGANEYGQLGLPVDADTSFPQPVPGLFGSLEAVAMSTLFSCVLGDDGTIRCFGDVPPDHSPPPGAPAPIEFSVPNAVAITATGNSPLGPVGHACALDAAGGAWCWGQSAGALGDGTTADRSTPTRVLSPVPFVQIAAGGEHTCALDADGGMWCWGHNGEGRLGDGTTIDRLVPTRVVGISDVVRIGAGGYHTCALRRDATVWCWGSNEAGQLGRGYVAPSFATSYPTPAPVINVTEVVTLAGGWKHTCALVRDGSVWCWGLNDLGQLGVPSSASTGTPVQASW